jgi:hypothetical protein
MAAELLRTDLICASDIYTDPDGTVELHTCGSLDAETLKPTDRPSLVHYEIEDSDGLHTLVRQQQLEDETIPPSTLRTVLMFRVLHFELAPLSDPSDPINPAESVDCSRPAKKVPQRVHLKISFDHKDTEKFP